MEKVTIQDVETQGLAAAKRWAWVKESPLGGNVDVFRIGPHLGGGEIDRPSASTTSPALANRVVDALNGPDYKALAERLAGACEMALHDQYGELVPDGWDVAEGLRAALAEYKAATEGGAA